eukprot:CAMPEP_0167767290 /NCGR_PEP_ID=MMETSP0110_2-20121227/15952_1 /TAXON_ID=629695 /ORGANISM="Gymnochlora sp., Strain CCMP2014" /LENGTH=179 /DNA_ID=CAMNT_0007655681 /DNA_START=1 /DNA_END=540 /DNA_ORIENTATION=-
MDLDNLDNLTATQPTQIDDASSIMNLPKYSGNHQEMKWIKGPCFRSTQKSCKVVLFNLNKDDILCDWKLNGLNDVKGGHTVFVEVFHPNSSTMISEVQKTVNNHASNAKVGIKAIRAEVLRIVGGFETKRTKSHYNNKSIKATHTTIALFVDLRGNVLRSPSIDVKVELLVKSHAIAKE